MQGKKEFIIGNPFLRYNVKSSKEALKDKSNPKYFVEKAKLMACLISSELRLDDLLPLFLDINTCYFYFHLTKMRWPRLI